MGHVEGIQARPAKVFGLRRALLLKTALHSNNSCSWLPRPLLGQTYPRGDPCKGPDLACLSLNESSESQLQIQLACLNGFLTPTILYLLHYFPRPVLALRISSSFGYTAMQQLWLVVTQNARRVCVKYRMPRENQNLRWALWFKRSICDCYVFMDSEIPRVILISVLNTSHI